MTIDQARLRSLIEAATKGPWAYEEDREGSSMGWICGPKGAALFDVRGDSATQAINAALIVAAVNALPALLDRVAELEEALAQIEQESNTPRKFWSARIAEIARTALHPKGDEND